MKRGVKSLILLAVLAALIGSYGLVNKLNQQAEVSEESGSFDLFEKSADEISAISWTNDGVEYRFVRQEDGWAKDGDPAFPVNQQAVEDMAERLSSMQASRRLTGVEQAEDYGFTEDSFAVTAEWADGETIRCIMGDETPFANGWYLRMDGEDGVVYTSVSSLEAMFAETDIDLAQLEEIGSVENAVSLQVGDGLNLVYREEGGFDPSQHWFSTEDEPMYDASVDALLAEIEDLEWQEMQKVNATDEELAAYALDDVGATLISVTGDDGASVDVYIGDTDDSGDRYARLPGSGMVYTLDGDSVASILAWDADALWNDGIFTSDYESIQQFSCTVNGTEQVFQHAETEETDETDETEATEAADSSEELWTQISDLCADSRSDAEAEGEALLTIAAVNTDGEELSCSFYSCDVDSYLAVTSQGRRLLVSADDVDKLIRMLR